MKQQISKFDGSYAFLSNFYPAEVEYEGVMYPTSEHAYQAAKTLDPAEREKIKNALTPGLAKKLGRKVTIREDWDVWKLGVMTAIVIDKFTRHHDLKRKLLETGDADLVEGNNWGDRYWGVDGTGQNKLGQLLMAIREDFNRMARS